LKRLALAALGVFCVGIGAAGVFVPGLPTTVFLIAASYLFARSCPWLEERLIRNRFFAPFHQYMDGKKPMPFRAKVMAMILMWTFVTASTIALAANHALPVWVPPLPAIAAVIGSWFIIRQGRNIRENAPNKSVAISRIQPSAASG
jgi:uncharacterized membrane protein YbaN (DUF454 family)